LKRLDLQQAMMRPVMRYLEPVPRKTGRRVNVGARALRSDQQATTLRYLEPVPRKTGRRVRAGARQWARALGSERSDLQATTLRY
jgi:hypothetical protein